MSKTQLQTYWNYKNPSTSYNKNATTKYRKIYIPKTCLYYNFNITNIWLPCQWSRPLQLVLIQGITWAWGQKLMILNLSTQQEQIYAHKVFCCSRFTCTINFPNLNSHSEVAPSKHYTIQPQQSALTHLFVTSKVLYPRLKYTSNITISLLHQGDCK